MQTFDGTIVFKFSSDFAIPTMQTLWHANACRKTFTINHDKLKLVTEHVGVLNSSICIEHSGSQRLFCGFSDATGLSTINRDLA